MCRGSAKPRWRRCGITWWFPEHAAADRPCVAGRHRTASLCRRTVPGRRQRTRPERHGGSVAAVAGTVAVARVRPRVALLVALGLVVGFGYTSRLAAQEMARQLPAGAVSTSLRVASDPARLLSGWGFVGVTDRHGNLAVTSPVPLDVDVGDQFHVEGRLRPGSNRLHRHRVSGWLTVRTHEKTGSAAGPLRLANDVRRVVKARFGSDDTRAALVVGFLVGDTARLDDAVIDDMRRAGLLHFVAVSGGNVAVFLLGIWLLLGIFPVGPRMRAAVGILATVVFVMVTRWEPSVIRAGLMIGLVLAGRVAGVPVFRLDCVGDHCLRTRGNRSSAGFRRRISALGSGDRRDNGGFRIPTNGQVAGCAQSGGSYSVSSACRDAAAARVLRHRSGVLGARQCCGGAFRVCSDGVRLGSGSRRSLDQRSHRPDGSGGRPRHRTAGGRAATGGGSGGMWTGRRWGDSASPTGRRGLSRRAGAGGGRAPGAAATCPDRNLPGRRAG